MPRFTTAPTETPPSVVAKVRAMASVLLLHAWWGRTPQVLELGSRFERAGFTTGVPDLYGDGGTADTIDGAQALADAADHDAMTERASAALAGLEPPVAVVGFSLGASVALDLIARGERVRAVVLYYGAGYVPEQISSPLAVLGHFASDDAYEPREYIDMMERGLPALGVPTTFHTYPETQHWFAEPDRPEYSPAAAALAWERTLTFLNAELQSA